jgi:hypothetical protein
VDSISLCFEGRALTDVLEELDSSVNLVLDELRRLQPLDSDSDSEIRGDGSDVWAGSPRSGSRAASETEAGGDDEGGRSRGMGSSLTASSSAGAAPVSYSGKSSMTTDSMLLQQQKEAAIVSLEKELTQYQLHREELRKVATALEDVASRSTMPAACWSAIFVLFNRHWARRTPSLIDTVVLRYFHLSSLHRERDGEDVTDHSRSCAFFIYTLSPTSVMYNVDPREMSYCDDSWPVLAPRVREAVHRILLEQHHWHL